MGSRNGNGPDRHDVTPMQDDDVGSEQTSFARTFVRGMVWTWGAQYGQYAIALGVTAVLARKLSVSDFGLVSMVVVFTGFLALLAEGGVATGVVQFRDLDTKALSSIFWLLVIFGSVLWGLTALTGPIVAWFFGDQRLTRIVEVLGGQLLPAAVSSVPLAMLRRQLRFRAISIVALLSTLVAGSGAVAAAVWGLGYWALVLHALIFSVTNLIGLCLAARWLPGWGLSLEPARRLARFSVNLLGFRTINYWARTADNLLIGKFLGAQALGFYGQSYRLMMIPLNSIAGAIGQTLHPVLARFQDDSARMGDAYLRVLTVVASLSFPIGAFFVLSGSPIVAVLYGPGWELAGQMLSIFGFVVMIQPMVSITGPLMLAKTRPDIMLKLAAFNTLLAIGAFLIGIRYGVVAVAMAYTVVSVLIAAPVTMIVVSKLCQYRGRQIVGAIWKPLIVAACGVAGGWLFSGTFAHWPDLLIIAVSGAVCAAVVAGFVFPALKGALGNHPQESESPGT